MYLTREEEKMLSGEYGEWVQKSIKLLIAIGEINKAEKFVEIKRAHLSGVSYKTVGDPILELLESIAEKGTKVRVFTTLNPAGIDTTHWKEFGFPNEFAEKQLRIINAFKKMGVNTTLTCTPYLTINRPKFGEPIAFAESSAVIYSNSIIGARTNRHGNLDALAAAITGRVPEMGLILTENRKATDLVKIDFTPKTDEEFNLLGLYIGDKLESNAIPALEFPKNIEFKEFHLRGLGAALAASGGVPMFHVIGYTPEAKDRKEAFQEDTPQEVFQISRDDLIEYKREIIDNFDKPDLIAIGCPHASLEEIEMITELVKGKRVKAGVKFWIFTSKYMLEQAKKKGYYRILEEAGVKIITDTCMVVAPLEAMGIKKIVSNSGKAVFYIPKLSKNIIRANIKELTEIIDKSME